MRKIVILGSGAGGTMVANKLRQELSEAEWEITIIDNDERHHYQPGWLFIPFGIYSEQDCWKPKRDFIPPGVEFVFDEVTRVDPQERKVETKGGSFDYDWLVVATGCRIAPEEVEGMMDDWMGNVHTFYSLEGAVALRKKMKYLESGKLVINIAELPYKCPVAPIEFIFMADWFYTIHGVRDKVEIEMVTPLSGIFTKPLATQALTVLAEKKNIKLTTLFDISQVNAKDKTIESFQGAKVDYDLLVSIPPHFGAKFLEESEVSDPTGFMETDKGTLKSKKFDRIYILGDATDVPTSKAGAVAHYQSDILVENILREIDSHEPKAIFDGHATCFIVSGYEKAVLIDFNYDIEPLPGMYPFPGVGPMTLLGESHANYWGKMMFKWVYWNMMMKGLDLPLEPQMTMAGKLRQAAA